jgi:peptidoglycan/xylan/chitin deacetylase (PgdA/CDA1 family)
MNPIVLYFHHIGSGVDHYTSVSKDSFERMLDAIQGAGNVVDLDSVAHHERPTFALTFDDGYDAVFGPPLETLEKRGLPATFFVVPQWLGRRAPHRWAPADMNCADADTLRDARDRGFGIASHTWSHAALDAASAAKVGWELDRGWAALAEESLGYGFETTVAYPYGLLPRSSPAGVTRGFATGRQPIACWQCRPLSITRVYLAENDDDWNMKIAGWINAQHGATNQCRDPHHRSVGFDR